MNDHVHTIVVLNSWALAAVKGRGNDVDLVAATNQAAGEALGKTRGAIDVRCKCVTRDNDSECACQSNLTA
jgi:hypothetical protein